MDQVDGWVVAGEAMSENRTDFELSMRRANKAWSKSRQLNPDTVKDFKWQTGRWYWVPRTFWNRYHGWNQTGGAALPVSHSQTYWLCMGWSTLTYLREKGENNGVG